MHENRIATLALIGFLALLPLGCRGPERVVLRGGTEHLPLLHDRLLRYQERRGGETIDYTMELKYHGGRAVREFGAEFKGIEMGRCNFISKGQLVYFETNRPLTAGDVLPEYRQLWVDESADQGDSWDDYDTGTVTVYAGREPVSVAAGNFNDCYKTVTTALPSLADSLKAFLDRDEMHREEFDRESQNAKMTIVRWFAPGVGLIKEQFDSPDYERELVEIVRPGVGQADTDSTNAETQNEEEMK